LKTIDGKILKQMILSGANHLENNKTMVNDLNVFPVPDGDTGTNMGLTISAAKTELLSFVDDEVGKCGKITAGALLRGARGNSGVILSLLFRGFAAGLKGLSVAGPADIANGWEMGVKAAYSAVMKPTEGTILTVARMAAAKATQTAASAQEVEEVFEALLEEARATLDKTPEMLPVLKQAGVVDAGGKGLVVILEGMMHYLRTGEIVELQAAEPQAELNTKADFSALDVESINFAYCTEFIVERDDASKDAGKLRKYLESIGDCVVVVDDEEIIKVHVHTNHPGNAFEEGIKYGMLCRMKVENMKEQHLRKQQEEAQAESAAGEVKPAVAAPEKEIGFVVISAGEGISNVFHDLGADVIVEGGQTMNPSTEDILSAVNATPASTVFVLPNNKNIIMAANQAKLVSEEKQVVVIESKTIPQGVCAMLQFDSGLSPEENQAAMTEALSSVRTGQITYAARDSVFDGHEIREGEILGLVENKVEFTGGSMESTMEDLLCRLADEDSEIVTVYYGADVQEETASKLVDRLQELRPELEFTLVYGGQPIYYYMISVE
jgi:DAK2 domain fusion protein YloV